MQLTTWNSVLLYRINSLFPSSHLLPMANAIPPKIIHYQKIKDLYLCKDQTIFDI